MNKTQFFAAVLCVAAAPAVAQNQGAPTLQVTAGSAMVSQGGEFAPVASGALVPAGTRVMLVEGSSATLMYPNGCAQSLNSAGVYSVPASCIAAANGSGGAGGRRDVDWGAVAIIGGGVAAIAGIAEATMNDSPKRPPPPPPISR